MPTGKPGTRKSKPPDLRDTPAQGKPLDGSKNPGGRPTEWTDNEIEELGHRLLSWVLSDPMAFYVAQFIEQEALCGRLCHKQRFSEFEAKNEKFSELYKVSKNIMEAHLGGQGTKGVIPPAMAVFGLKQHGHTDKQEVAHSGEVSTIHKYAMPDKRPIE